MFEVIDPVAFHREELPGLIAGRGATAARDLVGVGPLTLVVDGHAWTYRPDGDTVAVHEGDDPESRAVVELSTAAWSDLVQLARTVPALMLSGELSFARGGFGHLSRWEPALRALYAGIPIYDPATADLADLDLHRSFTLDDGDDDLAAFLARAGYLHVRGVFSAGEIAAFNAEVDRLAARARPGDDRSWWAKDADGNEVLCRLVYAGLDSDLIGGIEDDPRLRRIVALSGHEMRPVSDRMEGHSVLLKSPGQLQGLANIPWHTDCGLGGHPILCPSLGIGIQLTAATAAMGRIEAIAGSHGQTCRYALDGDLSGLPWVGLDTDPGDITVHYADLTHASPPPVGEGGRRVMYVSYVNPALFDHVPPGTAINDLVRNRQDQAGSLVRDS